VEIKQGQEHEEPRDLRARDFIIGGLAFFLLLGIVSVLMLVIFFSLNQMHSPYAPAPSAGTAGIRDAARVELQPYPRGERLLVEGRAAQELSTYGWTDREAGVVRIPIERAMKLSLEKGFPVRTDKPSAETAPGVS
jgi:hypothetical protein